MAVEKETPPTSQVPMGLAIHPALAGQSGDVWQLASGTGVLLCADHGIKEWQMGGSAKDVSGALFLDRDGVIIENRSQYIRGWEDVEFIPRSLQALKFAASSARKIFIVTNQSAIGRGLITLEEAQDINRRIVSIVERTGGRIDGVFMCPHAPGEGCQCRKPSPGLLKQARKEHEFDMKRSVLVGDAISDLRAGWAVGISELGLVKTGRGMQQIELAAPSELSRFPVFGDLHDALEALA